MSPRQHDTLGWQLVLYFTLLCGLCALAIGVYMVNARQHVGANYSALVADVVRAQQQPALLRSALMELSEEPRHVQAENFDNLLWRIPQHIQGVTYGLSRSQLDPGDYVPALEQLQRVRDELPEFQQRIRQVADDGDLPALLELGHAIEHDLAWAYSDLNEQIHRAAAEQRIIMERLTFSIGVLVLLVLVVVGGLMLALLRLNRQHARLAQLSRLDPLTGLHNRRHLLEVSHEFHQRSLRDSKPLSLTLIDLDRFKHINDNYGHPTGDRILQAFSQALLEETRQVDVVARLGGEEFCILMPDTSPSGAMEVAERLRQRIQAVSFKHLGVPYPITISLGVATDAGDDATFDRLYSRADEALYAAKSTGRNRTEVG